MVKIEELAEQVQNIPPEIYREIYDLTFTPNSQYHRINAGFKPSKLLAVDRESRTQFAIRYYGEDAVFSLKSLDLGQQWLASLQQSHLQSIRRIWCDHESSFKALPGKTTVGEWKGYTVQFSTAQRQRRNELSRALEPGVIYLAVPYGDDEIEKWIGNVEGLSKLRASLSKARKLGAMSSEESKGEGAGGLVMW